MNERLKLYLVTDSGILKDRDFYKCIEDALKGGVTTLQLREKESSGKEFLEKAYKLRALTIKYNTMFIINDRIDISLLVDADGVHVGQSDISVLEARRLLGNGKIIGVSTRSIEQALEAKKNGADYIGVGAIFGTKTKADAKTINIDTLKSIKENVDIPIVAIGGVNLENRKQLEECNIDGYAVVSAILGSEDIYKETKKWIK